METLIAFSGAYLAYVVIAIIAVAFALSPHRTNKRILAIALLAVVIGALAAVAGGALYSHPQPFAVEGIEPLIPHDIDNSFPSHHTLAAGLAASVAFLFNRRAGVLLFLAAVAVGWGRVAAGLHYPVDIIASLAIAILAVFLAHFAISRFRPAMLESERISPDHERDTN